MNEKKAKEALEAARVFISGLSQYDNLIMPRSAFAEAKGVLYTIGVAQGVYEAPVKLTGMPDVTVRTPVKPATGLVHRTAARELPASQLGRVDHSNCAEVPPAHAPSGIQFACICGKVMFADENSEDRRLWERVKTYYVLRPSVGGEVGARVLDGKFATAPESDAVREMLQRLVLR